MPGKKCPRCHNDVEGDPKACSYCNMLLKFEKRQSMFDKFVSHIPTTADLIQASVPDASEEAPELTGEAAKHDYLAGFFVTLEKLFALAMIVFFVLVALFWFAAPLMALLLYQFKTAWSVLLVCAFIMPFVGAAQYLTGACPYCNQKLSGIPKNEALTCKTCKSRVLVKNDRFYKML